MPIWSKLDYCIYKVSGDDAETFLQGQLTQDINKVTQQQAQLAAYCNAKGRMFAFLLLFRDHSNQLYFRINNDIAETVIRRLKMFVLRSKVVFEPMDFRVFGINDKLAQVLHFADNEPPVLGIQSCSEKIAIRLPGSKRYEVYVSQTAADALENTLLAAGAENPSAYLALDIRAGLFNIRPALSETILPQTTLLEAYGGIDYEKGCYVGQEIIARSKYLGSVKRQFMVSESPHKVIAGDGIFDKDNPLAEVLVSSYDEHCSSESCVIGAIISLTHEGSPLFIHQNPHTFKTINPEG